MHKFHWSSAFLQTFELLKIIENAGFSARIVGGAVRNVLLNKTINDFDIATTATPHQIKQIADSYNLQFWPTGIQYFSCRLLFNSIKYEITSLRREIYDTNFHCDMIPISSYEEDSWRRDFSINALYIDHYGTIYDYHHGLSDLMNQNIAFIGNSETRIQEDPTRIFRYLKFEALYGQDIVKYEDIIDKNIHFISDSHVQKSLHLISDILSTKSCNIRLYCVSILHSLMQNKKYKTKTCIFIKKFIENFTQTN